MRGLLSVGVFLFAGMTVPPVHAATNTNVNFDRDVRPILSDNCFSCHGPDAEQRKANLRLDTADGALEDRKSYKIIAPGDSANSRLYQRITAEKPAMRMPPPYSNHKLTPEQIDLLKRWIDSGAKYEVHWAYVAPVQPEPPTVKNKRWPRNDIDRFVLAHLEKENLPPSPEADKTTLIRRVTLDLTGLPPTPAEVDHFLADKSPNAYEKVVDRLLASPRYGERMAVDWLDLARYSDTHGYHIDSHRDMWHWRDWVISAFNRNMPYDEFTVDQIAGDLLPNGTTEQKLASGFNRNHMINFEGGAIPEEYQVEYVVDRVSTTSTTWLGLTMGCARCHDHKYDPIKQKDFYSFYAFFNTIPENGLDGRGGNATPVLQLPSDEEARELDRIKPRIAALSAGLDPKITDPLAEEWAVHALDHLPEAPRDHLLAHYEFDGNYADSSGHYRKARVAGASPSFGSGPVGKSVELNSTSLALGNGIPLNGPLSIAFWMNPGGDKRGELSVLRKADPDGCALQIALDPYQVIPGLRYGTHLIVRIRNSKGQSFELRSEGVLKTDKWTHVVLNNDGTGSASGIQIFVDGRPFEMAAGASAFAAPNPGDAFELGSADHGFRGSIDDLRFYGAPLTPEQATELFQDEGIKAVLAVPAVERTKEQKHTISEYYLTFTAPQPLRDEHAELRRLEGREKELNERIPTTMVMQEMEKPRETFILGRGQYDNHKEKVAPNVPAFLPPLPKNAPLSRLSLARWMVDPQNPLTARVAVNRYWQSYFGVGLVETAEDFGSQGDPPSHPQLLDWLATEFIRRKWDVKAMQRLIVTSATYRQSSRVTPDLLERDPRNRLLARGSRFRLEAEFVRDNALAASGLLFEQTGGPGVMSYQPKGLWEELAFGGYYSAQNYVQSHGPDLYRRSLYTFWKRTVPPAALATFDAPDREKCIARRARTNTPLQALDLLNDTTYVEASRALASRMILEGGRDPGSRITYGFRLATSRRPDPKERRIFRDMVERELSVYGKDEAAAEKLIAVGESKPDPGIGKSELAAWTTVASMMLNLDETITRE